MLICKDEGPLYLAVVPPVLMGWAQVVGGDAERAGGPVPSAYWQCPLVRPLLHLSPLPSFPNNCVQMPLGGARQGWRLHRVSGNPVPGRWGAGGVWVLSVSRVFLSSGVA